MSKIHSVVVATQNQHKLKEIREILNELPLDIKAMNEVGLGDLDVVEDGITFEENSMKKATEVMNASGYIAIADDSGLEVDALDNKPGVYSARYAGENATDKENNEKLLNMLGDLPLEERKGRFVSVISVAFPDGAKFHVRGECHGIIDYEERGENGFGYDPLFIVPGHDKTFGELSSSIKNKISHRANALRKLEKELGKYL